MKNQGRGGGEAVICAPKSKTRDCTEVQYLKTTPFQIIPKMNNLIFIELFASKIITEDHRR